MHSLIYKASPKYVMMISSKSPEAISIEAQRERKADSDKDHKAAGILEPTETGMMYIKNTSEGIPSP